MQSLIKPLLKGILILLLGLCLSGQIGCLQKKPPKIVIIPDSRVLYNLEGCSCVNGATFEKDWYAISGGYIRELFRACTSADTPIIYKIQKDNLKEGLKKQSDISAKRTGEKLNTDELLWLIKAREDLAELKGLPLKCITELEIK